MKNYKIAIIGCGTLGSQLAFQTAYCGHKTSVWLRSETLFNESQKRLDELKNEYLGAIDTMNTSKDYATWELGISSFDNFDYKDCINKVENAKNNISLDTNLLSVVKDADFVFELIPDEFESKRDFFIMLSKIVGKDTVITTGSSSILPSKIAKFSGNEANFLGTHFSNPIRRNNIIEVMVQNKTSTDAFSKTVKFAKTLNLNVIPVMKENKGYIMNAMLMPLLFSALDMYVKGISDVESIDKAWMVGTGAKNGPFRIMDKIGLKPVYGVVQEYCKIPSIVAPYKFKDIAKLLKNYINDGKLGMSVKEGFYKY